MDDTPASPVVPPTGDDKKPARSLNRVPRACNACRKQKMRCEGADNPPCKRCRNTGLECLFEKPSREASLTGEAGLERIRSLEAHVADIRTTQNSIHDNQVAMHHVLGQLLSEVRQTRLGTNYQRSPSLSSPALSTPTAAHPEGLPHQIPHFGPSHGRRVSYSAHSVSPAPPPHNHDFHQGHQSFDGRLPHMGPNSHQAGMALPPLSSLPGFGPLTQGPNLSAMRYQSEGSHSMMRHAYSPVYAGTKRSAGTSKVTSPHSSDLEDEDGGDLPARGLVAPLHVLQGLADVALEHARNGEPPSEAPSRAPSPGRHSRPSKRRKLTASISPGPSFSDVVTKNIITEQEARDLFRIFFNGCSTFLPIFDVNIDTFDALHERSPFAVNAICMAASRVRDGGGAASTTYTKILEQVQHISQYTLFSPVTRYEAVQSMLIIAGWSNNGWLCGGHAVRMAMELSMETSWPRLRKRILSQKADSATDRDLVTGTRAWFCLYLYEHQISYGTGRPAILRDDESIKESRLFLQHPLAVEDDMRLISTVELMALRERITNTMGPMDGLHIHDQHFQILRDAEQQFRQWFENWDQAFSQKYEDAAFYRQSLQIQQIFGLLYHNASALTGIYGPDDVQNMPPQQRDIAVRSIGLASQGLEIIATSSTYRQGMKYAVNYTHASATFAASLLLRLARLFPANCDVVKVRRQVESLATLMAEIPGKRYAMTLQMMLKRAKKRSLSSRDSSSSAALDLSGRPSSMLGAQQHAHSPGAHAAFPPYEPPPPHSPDTLQGEQMRPMIPVEYTPYQQPPTEAAEHLWRGFESMSTDQLPVWLSDQTMGGKSLARNGIEAFLLPNAFMPAPQIW